MPDVSVASHPSLDAAAWQSAAHEPAVVIADGSSVKVTVRDGHLSVDDGPPAGKRSRKFPRVPRTVSRLIILGGHGYVTVEAQRWLASAGIPWAVIDTYGSDQVIAHSGPAREDARLLRAQASAGAYGPNERAGLEITRALISAKLQGQAATLDQVFRADSQAAKLRDLTRWVTKAGTLPEIRNLEAQGASAYWQAWSGRVHTPFAPPAMTRVPAHWLTFAGRTSMQYEYEKNKDATDPVNAMLNYAYRIGETEAVHACHAYGLHPALGILHSDKQARDSLALDLLEAIRPAIDRVILGMVDTGLGIPYGPDGKPRCLDRRLFRETRDGTVRLEAPLTHTLASYATEWGSLIMPHAADTARVLALAARGEVGMPRAPRPYKQGSRAPLAAATHAPRLREGCGTDDLLPEHLYRKVAALIPQPPRSPMARSKTGRPADHSRDREIIAALAAHELLHVPWSAIPVPVSPQLCQARLREWSWVNAPGQSRPAWEGLVEVLQASGHLSALTG